MAVSGCQAPRLGPSLLLLLSGIGWGCGERGELVATATTPPIAPPASTPITPPTTPPEAPPTTPPETPPTTPPSDLDAVGRTKNEYGFALIDSFFLTPCLMVNGPDCLTTLAACPNLAAPAFEARGYRFSEAFAVGGDPLRRYDLTLKVNGIVEAKLYENGVRRSESDLTGANGAEGTDMLYIGGTPVPSDYNVFKISVFGRDYAALRGDVPLQYFYLNSLPPSPAVEARQTFLIGYSFTIAGVAGDAVIEFLTQDSNCLAVNNCGPGENGAACPAPRFVPNEPDLLLPTEYGRRKTAELDFIGAGSQPFHAQIVHVTLAGVQYSMP